MQGTNERRSLRLIRPVDSAGRSVTTKGKKLFIDSVAYYRQIEHYAKQIRRANDVDEIINILDVVLSETRELNFSDEVFAAREQVQQVEKSVVLLKAELEQLRELVHSDQLTGAFSRHGFDEIFVREAARADRSDAPLCVVSLDLDNFKQINDNYGHQIGDSALIRLVAIAKETLRSKDVVARNGGEEFVILLPNVSLKGGMSVIRRLQDNLAKKNLNHSQNKSILITFSAGVVVREFGEHQDSVLNRADKALYQAKHAGKNLVVPA